MLHGFADWRQDLHEKTSPSLADEWNERKYRYQKQNTATNIWNCEKSIENAGSYVPTCT
jgi:hypothetical protein